DAANVERGKDRVPSGRHTAGGGRGARGQNRPEKRPENPGVQRGGGWGQSPLRDRRGAIGVAEIHRGSHRERRVAAGDGISRGGRGKPEHRTTGDGDYRKCRGDRSWRSSRRVDRPEVHWGVGGRGTGRE